MATETVTNNVINVPGKFAGLTRMPLRQNVEVFREQSFAMAGGSPHDPAVVTLKLVSRDDQLDSNIIDRLICELCVRGIASTGYRPAKYRKTAMGWEFETFVKGDYSDRLIENAVHIYACACTPEATQWVLHLPTID